jgi:hypothetical protein
MKFMSFIRIHTYCCRPSVKYGWPKVAAVRSLISTLLFLIPIVASSPQPGMSQANPDLETYFRKYIGLSQDQIASIRNGQPVTKALPSRAPAEVLLFGAVYIHAAPEKYLQFARDYDRLRKLPNNLALGVFSDPPRLADLKGFAFDKSEISDLKNCKPGDCQIQIPASGMEELHKSINWSAADVNDQVNQLVQKTVSQGLITYQREGNVALGAYNDKPDPAEVPKQFAYMLSYGKALPVYLPEFYRYLLDYPKSKPANVEDSFYWAKVKFGLKPTMRVVQVVTLRGNPADPIACAIAEKQLYSSHYFETALDLAFCVRGTDDNKRPGFYLIMVMGSEQAGLTGVKGSIVRKTAVGRSVSNLKDALATIKSTLEGGH